MYIGIIETKGHGYKRHFTNDELLEIKRLRLEMRERLTRA
jgi:hypothetical protein